jgi:hypothetical protein
MLLGFNNDIPYDGKTYHVQTEDKGLKNPVITSQIYLKGKVVASKRVSYANIVGDPDCQKKIKKLMARQHIKMIKNLLEGRYKGEHKSGETEGETI